VPASVALGRTIGDRKVQRGRVLYLASENPDDIRMRWIAMSEVMRFEVNDIDLLFIPGVFKISAVESAIRQELERRGDIALAVVDTSAAFFEGTEENDNVAMGTHARRLRSLGLLPGGPTVLVNCHPTKNATSDNLQPRGGGAFIAEMDGNLTSTKRGDVTELHWQGKFRGPDFEPITFALVPTKTNRLVDSQGRQIPTVVARPVSENERGEIEKQVLNDEDAILVVLSKTPNLSLASVAIAANWILSTGKPHKSKADRILKALNKHKLVQPGRHGWALTDKGEKEAARLSGAAS
jgi:hypothetical protein